MTALRLALRRLSNQRASTALSLLLLAIGIAVAVGFFAVVDQVLMSGLPVKGGDRLVAFSTSEGAGWPLPLQDYEAIAARQTSFEWIGALRHFQVTLTRDDDTRTLIGSYVPVDLFRELGVVPRVGRDFERDDLDPARTPAVLISDRLWQDAYGGDPGILGATITFEGETSEIVGVMPPGMRFPARQDVWGVFGRTGRAWERGWVYGLARLRPGTPIADARFELETLAAGLDEDPNRPRFGAVDPLQRVAIGDRTAGSVQIALGASLFLLVLVRANLANLRWTDTAQRVADLRTRLALGASRTRLVAMLLLEHLVLALLGAGLGLGLAALLLRAVGRALIRGSELDRLFWIALSLDSRSANFGIVCALLATTAAALYPVLWTTFRLPRHTCDANRTSVRQAGHWNRGLAAAQIGLCFVLLVASMSWARRASQLLDREPGLPLDGLASIRVSTSHVEAGSPAELLDLFDRVVAELKLDPEVQTATVTGSLQGTQLAVRAGGTPPQPEIDPATTVFEMSHTAFETLDLDVIQPAGTPLGTRARFDPGPEGAWISLTLAQRLFEDEVLGQRLTLAPRYPSEAPRTLRVRGIVEDQNIERRDDPIRNAAIYLPLATRPSSLLVRLAPGVASARPALQRVLMRRAPRLGVGDELLYRDLHASRVWAERRLAQIFGLFGLGAMLTTGLGIYAVISVLLLQRRRELGIRIAVGARPEDLDRLVLGEVCRQLLWGLALGGPILLLARPVFAALALDGFRAELLPLVACGAVVAVCSLLACGAPMRRAHNTDPSEALASS